MRLKLFGSEKIVYLQSAQRVFNSGSTLSGPRWAATKQSQWQWFFGAIAPSTPDAVETLPTHDWQFFHVHPQKSWSVPIAPPCDPRPCPTTALVLQESHGIPQQDCLPNIAGFGWIRSLLQSEPAFCGNLAETSVMGSAGLPPHFTQTDAPVHCAWSLGGSRCHQLFFFPHLFFRLNALKGWREKTPSILMLLSNPTCRRYCSSYSHSVQQPALQHPSGSQE